MSRPAETERKPKVTSTRKLLVHGTALAALVLITGATISACIAGGETDPVAACEQAAQPVWNKVVAAKTKAELNAVPALDALPECKNLSDAQNKELTKRNATLIAAATANAVTIAFGEW